MNVKKLLEYANLEEIAKKEANNSWELNCNQTKSEEEKEAIRKRMEKYIFENFQKMLQIAPAVNKEGCKIGRAHV